MPLSVRYIINEVFGKSQVKNNKGFALSVRYIINDFFTVWQGRETPPHAVLVLIVSTDSRYNNSFALFFVNYPVRFVNAPAPKSRQISF